MDRPAHRLALPLSEQFPIEEDRQVPLFGVVQWVATKGDRIRDFGADDLERWLEPIQEVLARIRGNALRVEGRNAAGDPVRVDPIEFQGCRIAYPYQEAPGPMLDGVASYLQLFDYDFPGEVPDVDDEEGLTPDFNLDWHHDFNDRIWRHGEVVFSHLVVAGGEVLGLWNSSTWDASPPPAAKRAIVEEIERRFESGEMCEGANKEAEYLTCWYNETYRNGRKKLALQTVRGYVLPRHRQLKPGSK